MLRLKLLASTGLLALALAGCATGSGSVSQDIEKSLIGAHAAYDALSIALQTAATSGALTGSAATTAQSAYDQVGKDLALADADWAAGNTAGVTSAIATAASDTAKAQSLIPAAK